MKVQTPTPYGTWPSSGTGPAVRHRSSARSLSQSMIRRLVLVSNRTEMREFKWKAESAFRKTGA
jgi:hypothetical protein